MYIAGYACKGGATTQDLLLVYQKLIDTCDTNTALRTVAQRLLNKLIGMIDLSGAAADYLNIRRGGGGSFSIIFTYVVALLILFPKWAHLPNNSKWLLRYDPSKLDHCLAVWVDLYRKIGEICLQIFAFFQKFEPPDASIDPKFGQQLQRQKM